MRPDTDWLSVHPLDLAPTPSAHPPKSEAGSIIVRFRLTQVTVVASVVIALGVAIWRQGADSEDQAPSSARQKALGADGPGTTVPSTAIPAIREIAGEPLSDDPSAALDRSMTLHVKDAATLEPIAEASIYDSDSEETSFLGRTDDRGVYSTSQPVDRSVIVRARLYSEAAVELRDVDAAPRVIEVLLRRTAPIRGRVLAAESKEPVGEQVVVTWSGAGEAPSMGTFQEIRNSLDRGEEWVGKGIHVNLAASDGSFDIEGLDEDGGWKVIAAGRGWMSKQPELIEGSAERSGVELLVHRAFATRVRFVDEERNAIPVFGTTRLFPSMAFGISSASPGMGVWHLPNWVGLWQTDVPEQVRSDAERLFVLVSGSQNGGDRAMGALSCRVPGYEPVAVQVELSAAGAGAPSEHEVLLRELSRGAGRLRLVIEGGQVHGIDGDVHRSVPVGAVHLHGVEGDRFFIPVRESTAFEQIIDPVPAGRYALRFEASRSKLQYPAAGAAGLAVVVEPGMLSEAVVPLQLLGDVMIRLTGSRARQLDRIQILVSPFSQSVDPASGEMTVLTTSGVEEIGRPFTVAGLTSGTYQIGLWFPRVEQPMRQVYVVAGETVDVTFDLGE